MKVSARNQIPGRVIAIQPGAINGSVKIAVAGGIVLTANVTEEAIADLVLAEGDEVVALIKASDVLIGK